MSWSSASSNSSTKENGRSKNEDSPLSAIVSSPLFVSVSTLLGGASSYLIYWRYFKRIPNAAHLTPVTLRYRPTIVGRCTSVGDADGFRLYHTPGPPMLRKWLYPLPNKASSKSASLSSNNSHSQLKYKPGPDDTISIRLAGADAPESAHFGRPEQPFAKEAKQELENLALGRTIWCQVAHVDQYKRLVATPYVWLPPYVFGRTNISLRLVQRGLASVYSQAGAAYGSAGIFTRTFRKLFGLDRENETGKEDRRGGAIWGTLLPLSGEARLRRAQARARKKRLGMWSLKHVETPDDYKRRYRESSS